MSKIYIIIFLSLFLFSPEKGAIEEVNMRVGNDIAGNSVIGPRLPYGSSHPSPDTKNGGGDGYSFGQPVYGFSQMHASGAGGNSHYGIFLLSPQIGMSIIKNHHLSNVSKEEPLPYKYSCLLDKYGIYTSLVPTSHGAKYIFTYPASDTASIVLDCGFSIPRTIMGNFDYGADKGFLQYENDTCITGWGVYSGGWLYSPYKVYFAMSIDKKPLTKGVFLDSVANNDSQSIETKKRGNSFGAYLKFKTNPDEKITVSIAVSMQSINNAKQYLTTELINKSFESLENNAKQLWENQLAKIEIEGGDNEQRSIFYTCLARTMLTPADRTGDAPTFDGNEPYWDDQYCVWDTWRTMFPLMLLLNPDKYRDNINSFIKRFEINKRVDDAFAAGTESMTIDPDFRQGGDDVTNIIVEAYLKNVSGIDWGKAYNIVKNQADSIRWPSYISEGVLYFNKFRNPASTVLEFSYNDYLAHLMAKQLGFKDDANKYAERAKSWEKLWNPNVKDDGFSGFIQNIDTNRNWVFYPIKKKDLNGPHFYEGSSWVYSFFVPHNYPQLFKLCGGKEMYVKRLEHALNNNLIDYSNEPSFLTIRSFIDAGRPDLCSFWVRQNMNKYTLNNYPGDEDTGAMSSWFVFSAMGVFPKAGTDIYYLNSPVFPFVKINLGGGKTFTITAKNAGGENIYIKTAKLNGAELNKAMILHSDIVKGGKLEFVLTSKPTNWAIN